MMSLTRFSRFLFVATVAVGASLGVTNCGPEYAIYSVHVTAAKPTNNLASCKITITDDSGVPVVDKLPLAQQFGGTDPSGNPTLRQGCGGGLTPTNGFPGDTRHSNSRVGATFSMPVARGHTIKFTVANGVSARVGSRFTTYGAAYQFLWLD